ncbi:MAG: WYL domain-containing protein [Acidimicrobiales bacterium]
MLGIDQESALEVRLGEARPGLLALLRDAAAEHRRVALRCWLRPGQTSRLVDPRQVYADGGQWYLGAYCHTAQDERLFRLDRIEWAEPTGERSSRGARRPRRRVFHPGADDPQVVLRLEPAAAWLVEHYPTEAVRPLGTGGSRSRWRWLGGLARRRLLVRLGPDATVVRADPPLEATWAGGRRRGSWRAYGGA